MGRVEGEHYPTQGDWGVPSQEQGDEKSDYRRMDRERHAAGLDQIIYENGQFYSESVSFSKGRPSHSERPNCGRFKTILRLSSWDILCLYEISPSDLLRLHSGLGHFDWAGLPLLRRIERNHVSIRFQIGTHRIRRIQLSYAPAK
jgi:hypothetical protein